jgi:hypothetical protein
MRGPVSDPGRCPQCGADAVTPLTGFARWRRWFLDGGGWRTTIEVCGVCGASSGASSLYRRVEPPSMLRGVWQALRGVWQTSERLRAQRRVEPVPVAYAVLGALAAVAMVPVVLARPGWWPLVVLAPVAVGVVAFLGTLMTAVDRRRERPFRDAWDPRAGQAWEWAQVEDLVRREGPELAAVAPVGWDGEVLLGGHSASGSELGGARLTSLTVLADHGLPLPDDRGVPPPPAPRIECTTRRRDPAAASAVGGPDGWFEGVRQVTVRELIAAEHEQARQPTDPDELAGLGRRELEQRMRARWQEHERHRQQRREELGGGWVDGTVAVDDEAVPAQRIAGEGVEAALLLLDGQAVSIIAAGVALDEVAFTRRADLEVLLAARRARDAPWSG